MYLKRNQFILNKTSRVFSIVNKHLEDSLVKGEHNE